MYIFCSILLYVLAISLTYSCSYCFSVSNGLTPSPFQTGLLRTDNGDYLIEPVKGHKRSSEGHQPHLIYKRSALPNELHVTNSDGHEHEDSTCGVKGKTFDPILCL